MCSNRQQRMVMKSGLVYLDVCALCRPFDDQRYLRIRLESEAVQLILENIRYHRIRLVVSPVHYKEIQDIANAIDRNNILTLLDKHGESCNVNMTEARQKAESLCAAGFGIADGAHVAFAESVGADFVSCDDRLLKKCGKTRLNVWCGDPLQYCAKECLK